MPTRILLCGMSALSLFILTGCESGTVDPDPVKVEKEAGPDAKAMLLKMAETGEGGSAVEEIRMALDKKAAEGDAKAKAALSEVSELMNLQDKEAIKKKAKSIADKL